MAKSVVNVAGMSCNHCKMSVEKAVGSLKGVSEASVSLENNSVTVRYDESMVGMEQIKEAIEEAGYEVA